jgi:hypothetical protein
MKAQPLYDGVLGNFVLNILSYKDTILFATTTGLCLEKDKALTIYDSDLFLKKVFSVFVYNDTLFYVTKNELKENVRNVLVNGHTKKKYDLHATNYREESGYQVNPFVIAVATTNEKISMAFSDGKLRVYSFTKKTLELLDEYDMKGIKDVFYDKNKNLWIASTKGLFLKQNNEDPRLKLEASISHITSIKETLLYFGSGTLFLKPSDKEEFVPIPLCKDFRIKSSIEDWQGNLWFITDDEVGIINFDDKDGMITTNKQKSDTITNGTVTSNYALSIAADTKNKQILVGTEGKGVFVFKEEDLKDEHKCDFSLCSKVHAKDIGADKPKTFKVVPNKEFIIKYNTLTVPDNIIVYEGRSKKSKLWESGTVSTKGNDKVQKLKSTDSFITIEVIPDQKAKKGDTWWYEQE